MSCRTPSPSLHCQGPPILALICGTHHFFILFFILSFIFLSPLFPFFSLLSIGFPATRAEHGHASPLPVGRLRALRLSALLRPCATSPHPLHSPHPPRRLLSAMDDGSPTAPSPLPLGSSSVKDLTQPPAPCYLHGHRPDPAVRAVVARRRRARSLASYTSSLRRVPDDEWHSSSTSSTSNASVAQARRAGQTFRLPSVTSAETHAQGRRAPWCGWLMHATCLHPPWPGQSRWCGMGGSASGGQCGWVDRRQGCVATTVTGGVQPPSLDSGAGGRGCDGEEDA